jgi:hypothetical protein
MTRTIAEQERLYDLQKSGELYRKPALIVSARTMKQEERDILEWIVEIAQEHQQLATTIRDHVNGQPHYLLVGFSIMAAIERNQRALGLSQEQVYQICACVIPVVERLLCNPSRQA